MREPIRLGLGRGLGRASAQKPKRGTHMHRTHCFILTYYRQSLMRGHVLHPHLIWRGAAEELSQPDFWADYDIARILGECTMLDVRNAALGMQQRAPAVVSSDPPVLPTSPAPIGSFAESLSTSVVSAEPSVMSSSTVRNEGPPTPLSTSTQGRPRVSLQEMIATSVALKSGMDVEIVHPSASWSADIFPAIPSRSPSRSIDEAEERAETTPERSSSVGAQDVPLHVRQALAGLQREVLLLRNELNLELWSARENVKHIGRLYQTRVLSKTAEMERQGLVRVETSSATWLDPDCPCSVTRSAVTKQKLATCSESLRSTRSSRTLGEKHCRTTASRRKRS